MYILTTEMEAINLDMFMDYAGMQEEPFLAPVIALYTTTPPPATAACVSPYKRKYDTANDISQHLATASILKEVASLYYVNAELIEATLWLKKQFTDRKARLYRPSTAAA